MMKKMLKKIGQAIAPYFAYIIIKVLSVTMKFDYLHSGKISELHEKGVQIIMSFWHSRLLMMPLVYKGKEIKLLISIHADGGMLNDAMEMFGFESIRGSTTRGATKALREMVRAMKAGSDIAITPDGPKGPRQAAQNGAVVLAKMTGAPICPVTYGASKRKQFSSWDGFILPYPFSRGVFMWGKPIYVDKEADKEEIERKRVELETEMNRIIKEADSYF